MAAGQRASLQPSDSARDKLHVAPSCAVTARVRDLRPPPHAAEQRPNDDHGPTVHTEAASEPRRDCHTLERVTPLANHASTTYRSTAQPRTTRWHNPKRASKTGHCCTWTRSSLHSPRQSRLRSWIRPHMLGDARSVFECREHRRRHHHERHEPLRRKRELETRPSLWPHRGIHRSAS